MPRGANPGERRGGRAKGTPNRRTIEQRLFGERRASGRPLAKEVLEEGMLKYLELASKNLPTSSGKWDKSRERRFHFYRQKADERARLLAPFQSPTFRSITVQPPQQRAHKGTPALDALESFVLRLARARRLNPPQTIDAVADEAPAVKVIDGKTGGLN